MTLTTEKIDNAFNAIAHSLSKEMSPEQESEITEVLKSKATAKMIIPASLFAMGAIRLESMLATILYLGINIGRSLEQAEAMDKIFANTEN